MRIHHRDVVVDIADDDLRVPLIEALLFMKKPGSAAPVTPPVVLSPALRAFWKELPNLAKRELLLLAEAPYRTTEIESALGVGEDRIRGMHSGITRLARKHRVAMAVTPRGKGRAGRRYHLADTLKPIVRALGAEAPPKA